MCTVLCKHPTGWEVIFSHFVLGRAVRCPSNRRNAPMGYQGSKSGPPTPHAETPAFINTLTDVLKILQKVEHVVDTH